MTASPVRVPSRPRVAVQRSPAAHSLELCEHAGRHASRAEQATTARRGRDPLQARARNEATRCAPATQATHPISAAVEAFAHQESDFRAAQESCPDTATLARIEAAIVALPGRRHSLVRALARFDDAGCFALLHRHGRDLPGVAESLYRMVQRGVTRLDAKGRPLAPSLVLELRDGRGVRRARALEAIRALAGLLMPEARVAVSALDAVHEPRQGKACALLALRVLDHPARQREVLLDQHGAHLAWLAGEVAAMTDGLVWIDGWPFERSHWMTSRVVSIYVAAWCEREREGPRLSASPLARVVNPGGPL